MPFTYIETKPKNTRAQKRKDAKAAKKAEQVKRIEDCTKLDEHKDRRLEKEKLDKLLKSKNLRIHDIDADGDCVYRAIEHQLSLFKNLNKPLSYQELRTRTSEYMLDHPDRFLPFLTTDQGDIMDEQQYETYCRNIARTKEWGGHLELSAIANIVKKPIHIFQADQSKPIVIETELENEESNSPILLSFHKYLYHLGEHYNSLIKLEIVTNS